MIRLDAYTDIHKNIMRGVLILIQIIIFAFVCRSLRRQHKTSHEKYSSHPSIFITYRTYATTDIIPIRNIINTRTASLHTTLLPACCYHQRSRWCYWHTIIPLVLGSEDLFASLRFEARSLLKAFGSPLFGLLRVQFILHVIKGRPS